MTRFISVSAEIQTYRTYIVFFGIDILENTEQFIVRHDAGKHIVLIHHGNHIYGCIIKLPDVFRIVRKKFLLLCQPVEQHGGVVMLCRHYGGIFQSGWRAADSSQSQYRVQAAAPPVEECERHSMRFRGSYLPYSSNGYQPPYR